MLPKFLVQAQKANGSNSARSSAYVYARVYVHANAYVSTRAYVHVSAYVSTLAWSPPVPLFPPETVSMPCICFGLNLPRFTLPPCPCAVLVSEHA